MHVSRRAVRVGLPVLIAALALVAPATVSGVAPHPVPRGHYLRGTPGDDVIVDNPGPDTIKGFAGNDTLSGEDGPDRLFGGPGTDTLDGGPGNDLLKGGPDADTIGGGPGKDVIHAARDGAIDTVSCGDGDRDIAIVDATDIVAPDCERVRTPGS